MYSSIIEIKKMQMFLHEDNLKGTIKRCKRI